MFDSGIFELYFAKPEVLAGILDRDSPACEFGYLSEYFSENIGWHSDVESDDYSESARSYELGKASDFGCERPDFSAFLCLWRKVTIGWEMRPVRLVLQNIRNFFSQNGWCLPFTKIVGPVRAAIRRKVQVRKVREKPGGRLFTTFTDVLRPLTSLRGAWLTTIV